MVGAVGVAEVIGNTCLEFNDCVVAVVVGSITEHVGFDTVVVHVPQDGGLEGDGPGLGLAEVEVEVKTYLGSPGVAVLSHSVGIVGVEPACSGYGLELEYTGSTGITGEGVHKVEGTEYAYILMVKCVGGFQTGPGGGVHAPLAFYTETEDRGDLLAEFSTGDAAGCLKETYILHRGNHTTLEGERPVVKELRAGNGGLSLRCYCAHGESSEKDNFLHENLNLIVEL